MLVFFPFLVFAKDDVDFNSAFLMGNNKIDTTRYAQGNPVAPGIYAIQVYLNNKQKLNNTKIKFVSNSTFQASPCLPANMMETLSVDVSKAITALPVDESCLSDLDKYFPGSTLVYDPLTLRMDITIPQTFLLTIPPGMVPPSRWDNGIPALLLAYDTNYYHHVNDNASDTAYAGLTYGANLGAWRLRARGSLNWDSDSGTPTYDSQNIYLQRDIAALRAQLVLGDSSTKGYAFDTLNIRGLRVYNDTRMYSTSENNYAPIIRGVAKSNAKVTVKQNGSRMYETTVPPGPFTLTDVTPSGYGSDLEVTVEEADGSKVYFTVPYSSVPQLVRKNYSRWEIAAGELNDDSLGEKPKLAQLTAYYGLSDRMTGYTGIQASDQRYMALLAGVAVNTSMGAIAADFTHSQAHFDSDAQATLSGDSYRVTYSNMVAATQTSFSLAAYRFSTRNYLTLHDAAAINDTLNDQSLKNSNDYQRIRDQLQLNINQPLHWGDTDLGSFYLSGTWETYWGGYSDTQQYSFGYSNSWKALSYSVSLQRSYDLDGQKNDSAFLNFSIPFSAFTSDHHNPAGFSLLSSGISNDSQGNAQISSNASGATAGNEFSYSVNASSHFGGSGETATSSLGTFVSWNSGYGPVNASASTTDGDGGQLSLGHSGGLVVHSGGFTFAPDSISADNSMALLHAGGAEGAKITMGNGEIDQSGYGMATYLSPYRENRIGLNIDTLQGDVEVKNTSTTIVPTNGAIIRVDFETDQGRSVLLMLTRNDGGTIPLGASVMDESGTDVGSVGQSGYAYVRGIAEAGTLHIIWGSKSDEMCSVAYQIPASPQMADKTAVLSSQRCVMSTSLVQAQRSH